MADAGFGEVDVLRTGSGGVGVPAVRHGRPPSPSRVPAVCRKAVEIAGPAVETWAQRVADEHGYTDLSHTVEIFGCAGSAASSGVRLRTSHPERRPRAASADVAQDTAAGRPVDTVRRLDSSEATELAALAGVFDDLQYALRCCEHLVGALARPAVDNGGGDTALVEALWTGALVAYARCFSGRTKILADADLAELKLDGDVAGFHRALLRLRPLRLTAHQPRETFTVGVAQGTGGTAAGVAVVGATTCGRRTTVRQLGRIAYGSAGSWMPGCRSRSRGARRRPGSTPHGSRRCRWWTCKYRPDRPRDPAPDHPAGDGVRTGTGHGPAGTPARSTTVRPPPQCPPRRTGR
jgi:hypothetical protein